MQPGEGRYLFVYPFVKTREWYALSRQERQEMIDEHIVVGRRHPGFRLNTTYSYGLDDQEFVVAFEGDDAAGFLDMVMALRETRASRYTLRDTPSFTCVQLGLCDVLDTLGGEPAARAAAAGGGARRRLRAGRSPLGAAARHEPSRLRVGRAGGAVQRGRPAVRAGEPLLARARLALRGQGRRRSTGTVTCPWHDGRFALTTGDPVPARPPRCRLLRRRRWRTTW